MYKDIQAALPGGSVKFAGPLGNALRLTVENRLKKVDYEKLVRSFRDHEDGDSRWRGDFWGKIVRSAIRVLQANPDPELEKMVRDAVHGLCDCIEPDGCISTYPKEKRLQDWDAWGRKYAILGLCRYYRYIEQEPRVLETIRRMTANFIASFPGGARPGDKLHWHDGMPANSILGAVELAARLTAEMFSRKAEEYGMKKPQLKLEPARYFVGNAGWLVGRVHSIKESYRKIVGTDIGMNTLARPAMYGSYHHIYVNRKEDHARAVLGLCGQLCENTDFWVKERELPADIAEGDLVVVENAGAYGFGMSYQYNGRLRPAEVLIHEGKAELIRDRETFEDMVRHTHVPAHLTE